MPTKPTARLYYAAGLIKGFAEQLRGNPKLKAELDKVVSQLQCGETYSAKFALKKNPKNALPIFGARGSLETRFLFIPHEGKLVLIGIIENHRYKASKFFEHPKTLIAAIRKGALKELASLPEFLATIEVSTATVETDGGGAPEPRGGGAEKPLLLQEVYPSHGAWIALSDEQGEVAEKAMLLPAVITGPPGSGKTALLEMLVDMRASLKDEQKPILVVANSAPLANALRAEYQDTHTAPVGGGGSAAKPDTLPVFQSYQDFLGLSTAELVSVDYFVQWLLSPAFPARRAEKEKLNLKPETLYEEMKRLHGLWVQACLSMPEASEEEINQRTYKLYCDFPPTHSYLAKGKNEFFNLIYLPYQTALAHETKKDLHFPDAKAIAHVIRAQADCTAVFADEAQDFGAAAIALLTQAAKNLDAPTAPPALLVCGDDNQNLRGGRFSAIAEIKRQLRLDDTSIHYLSTSFRMAPNITNATQLILAMQQQVRGGAASQYSYTEVSEDKTQKRGNVEWMRVPQKKNLLNWMTSEAGVALEQRLYEEGATILILDVAQREQAQGCFPRCTVKTAEESKGLEMPSIALFSPFGTPKAIALAKLITDRLPKVSSEAPSLAPLLDLVGLRKSKPKAKDKQLSELSDEALDWLSALVVSLSRAKQSCCVISGGVEAHQAHALDKACAEAFKKFTAVVIITKEERIETALTNITQLLNQQDIEGARAHYEEYIGLPGFDKKGTIKAKIFPEPILPEPTASLSQTPPTSPSSGGGRAAPKPKTAEQIGAEKKRKNKQKKLRQKAAKNPKIKKFFEGFERIGKACKLPSPPSKDEREGLMKSILEQLRTISSLEEKAMLKSLINQPSIGANGYTPLHFAASSGNQPLILLLVSLGAQANSKNKEGGTPLHSACQAGQRASVELLLMSGARVDAKSNMGWTPLHSAVSNDNNLEIAKILIKNMPTVNIPDSHGWTPLHLACGGRIWRKSTEIVAALLEKQTNIDVINSEGQTPLHLAAGDFAPPSLVSLLLEAGASTSIQCGQGYTPLIQALEATAFQDYERDLLNVPEAKKTDVLDVKNIDILEVFLTHLLKKKEDVSSILVDKKYGGVLFKTALLRGGPKLLAPFIPYLKDNPHIQEAGLSFIMAHKGNPKDYSSTFYFFLDELFKLENFSTIIMDFIEAPLKNDALSPHILQAFFLRGLSPDACFSSGEHLLLLACRSSLKSIDVILAAGADPNIKTKDYTLLQLAASSAAIPTAKKLLAAKK